MSLCDGEGGLGRMCWEQFGIEIIGCIDARWSDCICSLYVRY